MSFRSPGTTVGPAPKVSVIMAVYNGERYVRQAIDSILAQTFDDFELVLVDDGSTDDTAEILDSYDDSRIVKVKNPQNIGLTRSLNRGIDAARGELLARQDGDDASLPERLVEQVGFMEAHPAVGLVGSGSRWINGQDEPIRDWRPPTDPAEIQQRLLASIPFLHGTFMFRRACLEDIGGGYDEGMSVAQDCDLLLRISERWDLANLPDVLYVHRRHQNTVTARRGEEQQQYLFRARQAAIQRRLAYGWGRLRIVKTALPDWVSSADRRWLARRYVWWSAGSRELNRKIAAQFLLIALLLDTTTPEIWSYANGILARKLGLASDQDE